MLNAQFVSFGVRANVGAACEERQIMLPREFGDEALVGVCFFTAQLVIEVRDVKNKPESLAQLQQHAQQRNRIRAAGNSDRDPVARIEQLGVTFAIELEDLFAH